MHLRRTVRPWIFVSLLCGACQRDDPAGAPAAAAAPALSSAPVAAAALPSPLPVEETRVELLEAGKEPRAALRYDFAVGARDSVVIRADNDVTVESNGQKREQKTPAVEMGFDFSVVEVLPNGQARVERAVRRVAFGADREGATEANAALDQVTKGLTGLSMTQTFSPRGIVSEVEIDADSIRDPALRPLMETMQTRFGQMGAPLPEEPVGLGAKWRVVTAIEVQGMSLNQTVTFALLERTERGGKLTVELEQTAKPGAVSVPGGESVELVRMATAGTGSVDFDLRSPVTVGALDMTSQVEMKGGAVGSTRTLSKMHVEMRREDPAGPGAQGGSKP